MGGGVAQPQSVLRSLVADAAWERGGTSVSPTVARLLAYNQSNDPALRCSSCRRLPQVASNSPINAYSWVGGFEIAPNKMTGFYAYYSGLYGEKNQAIDTTGSYIGWGYSGASNGADRYVQEFTTGYSRTI